MDANPDGSDRVRLFVETPVEDLSNYSLFDLAWMRIVASEWVSVPPARPGWGPLVVGNSPREYRAIREVVSAFESLDTASIRSAIEAAARLTGTRKFSLFGLALADEARRLGLDVGLGDYAF